MTKTGLSERRPAYHLAFSLFGIPVRVSVWFWVMGAVLGYSTLQAGVQARSANDHGLFENE